MTKPTLKKIEEFRQALNDYHVSGHGSEILSRIKLVLLRAPSAGGRNTIIRELVKTGVYEFIVSDTTRPPRANDGVMEQDGVEYWFRQEDDFLKELSKGEYLEAEIIHNQQVSGTSIRELEKSLNHDKICINEVHFVGAENIMRLKPDTNLIFITPPSFDQWIKRLKGRGDISEEEFENRFRSAKDDYEHALTHDYYKFVLNDSYLHSAEHVRRIVETNDYPKGVNQEAREISEQVYEEILKHL